MAVCSRPRDAERSTADMFSIKDVMIETWLVLVRLVSTVKGELDEGTTWVILRDFIRLRQLRKRSSAKTSQVRDPNCVIIALGRLRCSSVTVPVSILLFEQRNEKLTTHVSSASFAEKGQVRSM